MKFVPPTGAKRKPSILPLVGVSMLPVAFVLAMTCFSLSREEESVRMPASAARPPSARETPMITVRLSQQGAVTLAGQSMPDDALPAAWQRERAALRMLGFEPAQATVVVHADRDLSTDKVQQLMETAQGAGFTRCVLQQGPKP